MRSLIAGLAFLSASAAFAQQSLAMPQVDVTADRVQHAPALALTLKTETFGCDVPIEPGVIDASDALQFASGPFAEYAEAQTMPQLAPLLSVSWSEGLHFNVVGAPVPAWRRLQFVHRSWHATGC
jgi:hypothetical protein